MKIGSSLVTNEGSGLDARALDSWTSQIAYLKDQGNEVVVVSSGAVAEGIKRLGWSLRPRGIHELQAAAAVGQVGLVEAYEKHFRQSNVKTAQILLTHEDFSNRTRYLNARSTMNTLISMNIVPIVNENDTVATSEIQFGDNDTLAAMVANLLEANLLIILTDQDGLFSMDPKSTQKGKLIKRAKAGDKKLEKMASNKPGGQLGSGGMLTKVLAAKTAARSGAHTIIAPGKKKDILCRLLAGESLGTILLATQEPLDAKRKWLADNLKISGSVIVDPGAVKALRRDGGSLLTVGIKKVIGKFNRGELITCKDQNGNEIARGLANYDSNETAKIMGLSSSRIEKVLGYVAESELIHRDNLVVT